MDKRRRVFQSLGRTDLIFQCGAVTTGLSVVGISFGLATGDMVWVARLVSAAIASHIVVVTVQLVCRGFGRSPSCMLAFLPAVSVAAVSGDEG